MLATPKNQSNPCPYSDVVKSTRCNCFVLCVYFSVSSFFYLGSCRLGHLSVQDIYPTDDTGTHTDTSTLE